MYQSFFELIEKNYRLLKIILTTFVTSKLSEFKNKIVVNLLLINIIFQIQIYLLFSFTFKCIISQLNTKSYTKE